ncbi:MurR/RpiR family transcriptional regulator [Micromonospora yasonensis]|uniref:MurR/RpiR family transcriptional regulator n=1 Tax=Micromonospora yasonensis TaxID=1128667 RepID=UPI00222E18F9|nr:MurR/RpiR family transcriptional regulator [Micromonospora yasonensis]MCW3844340.1 MurR/RpiR family transcriptional regulator [Micromonospora yasonensis]
MASTTSGPGSTLPERVAARRDLLSPAEQAVAQFMADNPQEVAFASAEKLGRLTGTSDATVIRTVKALGYSGLPSLKRALQESLRDRLTPAGRLNRSLDAVGDDLKQVFDVVVTEQIGLLESARHSVQPAEFVKAVTAIRDADYVLTCAVGILGQLAEYFTIRMLRQGRRARAVQASGFLFADALVPLSSGDVVVLVSHHHVKPEEEVVLEHAERVGARVILITDTLGGALSDRVEAVLSAEVNRHDRLSSITVTVTVLEALSLALAAEQRERASAAMHRLTTVRNRLAEVIAEEVGTTRRRTRRPAEPD